MHHKGRGVSKQMECNYNRLFCWEYLLCFLFLFCAKGQYGKWGFKKLCMHVFHRTNQHLCHILLTDLRREKTKDNADSRSVLQISSKNSIVHTHQ